MTIIEKLNKVYLEKSYTFCEMNFSLFLNKDYFKIYDKVNGTCIYSDLLENVNNLPEELATKEYKSEELIKLEIDNPSSAFAVCFYLDAPEKIEKPISAGVRFI